MAYCPQCGTKLSDVAKFCGNCGEPISTSVQQPSTQLSAAQSPAPAQEFSQPVVQESQSPVQQPQPSSAQQPQTPADVAKTTVMQPISPLTSASTMANARVNAALAAKRAQRNRVITIVAIVIVAVALIAGAVLGVMHWRSVQAQKAWETQHVPISLTVPVDAGAYKSEAGSKIPISITGIDLDGNKVDLLRFVDEHGKQLKLVRGSYSLSIPASPIAKDGTMYDVPSNKVSVNIGDDGKPAITGKFEIKVAAAVSTTNDQIEAAYRYAAKGGTDMQTAADLKKTATEYRDSAVQSKDAADHAKKQQALAKQRHVTADRFEFDIPQYWQDRVTVKVNGDQVGVYSKKYPDLKVCWFEVTRTEGITGGDIATSLIGSTKLDASDSVAVWATRWAYLTASDAVYNSSYAGVNEAQATELTDLQTGGQVKYADIYNQLVDSKLQESDLLFRIDDYLQSNVVSTITVK